MPAQRTVGHGVCRGPVQGGGLTPAEPLFRRHVTPRPQDAVRDRPNDAMSS